MVEYLDLKLPTLEELQQYKEQVIRNIKKLNKLKKEVENEIKNRGVL